MEAESWLKLAIGIFILGIAVPFACAYHFWGTVPLVNLAGGCVNLMGGIIIVSQLCCLMAVLSKL
jgi:hypothetical protein